MKPMNILSVVSAPNKQKP